MTWSLILLLMALGSGQAQDSGAQMPEGMTMLPPDVRAFSRCTENLGGDGTANSRLTVRCETVRDGRPEGCRLEQGRDAPVRHRQAARCLAPLYRFVDASGQPANGGPVVIPVRLNITVRDIY